MDAFAHIKKVLIAWTGAGICLNTSYVEAMRIKVHLLLLQSFSMFSIPM